MQVITLDQLQHVSGGCDSWYHFIYCRDSGAYQNEVEMQYGSTEVESETPILDFGI